MTESDSNIPGEEWRSKKYVRLSDEEILELYLKKLPDKDRYYLMQEIDYRGLNQEALDHKTSKTKAEMKSKSWWKYLPLLFALVFVLKRMFGTF